MNSEGKQDWPPRILVVIVVVLFVLNFQVMLFTGTLYENHEDAEWGRAAIIVTIATAIALLTSLILSVFGRYQPSKAFLVVGIGGLAISSVSFGLKLMDKVWNH